MWNYTVLNNILLPNDCIAEEKLNADMYASNVAQMLSKLSGIPMCQKSAVEYLAELNTAREHFPELKKEGWRGFCALGSGLRVAKYKKGI